MRVHSAKRHITPLGWAVIHDDPKQARALIQQGGHSIRDAIRPGESALRFAIRKGASIALIGELSQHPELTPRELESIETTVKTSIYLDHRYQQRLLKVLRKQSLPPISKRSPKLFQPTASALSKAWASLLGLLAITK